MEKDVTTNAEYMNELKTLMGRFVTPVLVIDGDTFLGFGANLARIQETLRKAGYLQ